VEELDRAEAAAFRDIYEAPPPALAEQHGLAVAVVGEAVCGAARALPGVPDLNHVVGAGPETDLDAVAAFYAGLAHIVAVSPHSGDLAARLQAAGYTPAYPWMKFVRAADPPPAASSTLRVAVAGADRAEDFAAPVAAGFGMPPFMREHLAQLPGRDGWTCVAAYDGDRPVAGAALFVTGDHGWLGMGAVVPGERGRGAQGALLAERIRLAAEAGCRTVTTETGVRQEGRPAYSYRNILRAGFEEAYERPNWASPA
jgi:hypothetical protein